MSCADHNRAFTITIRASALRLKLLIFFFFFKTDIIVFVIRTAVDDLTSKGCYKLITAGTFPTQLLHSRTSLNALAMSNFSALSFMSGEINIACTQAMSSDVASSDLAMWISGA